MDPQIRAVTALLRSDWDPIGHGAIAHLPEDEYESYAPQIVSMIRESQDDAAIAAYLAQLEADTICVPSIIDLIRFAGKLRTAVREARTTPGEGEEIHG